MTTTAPAAARLAEATASWFTPAAGARAINTAAAARAIKLISRPRSLTVKF
jgi:hypothetical protein